MQVIFHQTTTLSLGVRKDMPNMLSFHLHSLKVGEISGADWI